MKAIIALGALAVGGGAVFLLMKHPAGQTDNPLPPPGKGICYTADDVWSAVADVANDPTISADGLRSAAGFLQTETMCDDNAKAAAAEGVVVLNTRASMKDAGIEPPQFVKPANFPTLGAPVYAPSNIVSRTIGHCEACDNGE